MSGPKPRRVEITLSIEDYRNRERRRANLRRAVKNLQTKYLLAVADAMRAKEKVKTLEEEIRDLQKRSAQEDTGATIHPIGGEKSA